MGIEKAHKRISKTKKQLKAYGCSFEEYMKDLGRQVFTLGSEVQVFGGGKGIICGWNSSANYDVYLFDEDEICNIHPSDISL